MPYLHTDTNPAYIVLVNHEGQHSLWSATVDIPEGWNVEYGPTTRESCADYIEEHWKDIRPRSLRDAETGSISPLT